MERASSGFDLELEQVRVRALRAYASAAGATDDAVRLEARLAELGGELAQAPPRDRGLTGLLGLAPDELALVWVVVAATADPAITPLLASLGPRAGRVGISLVQAVAILALEPARARALADEIAADRPLISLGLLELSGGEPDAVTRRHALGAFIERSPTAVRVVSSGDAPPLETSRPVVRLAMQRPSPPPVLAPDRRRADLPREAPRCAGRARHAAVAAAPRPGVSLGWLFLIALAACSSRTEPQPDPSQRVARDRPIDAAGPESWPAWAERELPDLDLFAGGGRAVATWAGERCHLAVLNAPAEPKELVEYVLGLEVLHEPWNRCGPVAVTADAVYFVDRAHVVRWRDGVRTELLALESVYDIALASAGDALYVVTQFLFTTRVRRIDAAGVQEVATFDGGIQGVVTVGEDLVVWLGTRISRIHEGEVTTLRTFALQEPLPTIAGVTPTHLVLCNGGVFELLPVAGGAASRGTACAPGHPFDGIVRDDEVYIASFPPPTELIQSSLTGTARRVVLTSPDEIGDLTPAGAYVYYSTMSEPTGLERIRWLKRADASAPR